MKPRTARWIGTLTVIVLGMLATFGSGEEKKPAEKRTPATKPEQEPTKDVKPAPVPDPTDIIRELEKEKPETPVLMPTDPKGVVKTVAKPAPSVTPSQKDSPNLPDGYVLVDRVGRLVREGDWRVFAFRSDENRTVRDRPMRLLPSRWLENMEIAAARGKKSTLFRVSGEVTEYHGVNYLLLRKVLIVRDQGNLQ